MESYNNNIKKLTDIIFSLVNEGDALYEASKIQDELQEQHKKLIALAHRLTATNPDVKRELLKLLND